MLSLKWFLLTLLIVSMASIAIIGNIPLIPNSYNVTNAHLKSLPTKTLDGATFDILADKGWKAVYFWGEECPCVKDCEKYTLIPLAKHYKREVKFYAVISGSYELGKPVAEIRSEAAKRHLPYPLLMDNTHFVAEALNGKVTPQVILLDPHNHIVFSGMPDDSKSFLQENGKSGFKKQFLKDAIQQGLAGKKISRATTPLAGCLVVW